MWDFEENITDFHEIDGAWHVRQTITEVMAKNHSFFKTFSPRVYSLLKSPGIDSSKKLIF